MIVSFTSGSFWGKRKLFRLYDVTLSILRYLESPWGKTSAGEFQENLNNDFHMVLQVTLQNRAEYRLSVILENSPYSMPTIL